MIYVNEKSKRVNEFRKIYDDKLFKDILENKKCIPKFPKIIDIELTNHCNLNCLFCTQQGMKREKGGMNWEVYRKIIDECEKYGAAIRFIRWGEPFLNKNIIEYCRYAKSKKLLIHITNNGQVINEEQMKEIVDLEVDSLVFSFQGATKEEYEIMRNNTNYEMLKDNVLKMVEIRGKKEKPFIHISSTMTDDNEEDIADFVKYWGNIVDSISIGKTNLSLLTKEQIINLENAKKISNLRIKETIKKIYRPCTEIYQKLSVDWDGKITACCNDYDNMMCLGNIQENSLYEIWNDSQGLQAFRKLLDNNMHKSLELCKTCYATYEEF